MTKADIKNLVQSLSLANIKPMCDDHQPTGRYARFPEEMGGGVTYEVTCPNCNFHAYVHPDYVDNELE